MENSKSFQRIHPLFAFKPDWLCKKMIFLAGPRQVGKTHIAKSYLKERQCSDCYFNLDIESVNLEFARDKLFFESNVRNHPKFRT